MRWFSYRLRKVEVRAGLEAICTAIERSPAKVAKLIERLKNNSSGDRDIEAQLRGLNEVLTTSPASRDDLDAFKHIEAQVAQALRNAEADFIAMTLAAGWFDVRIPANDITNGLGAVLAVDNYPLSRWDRLKQQRNHLAARTRKGDVRIKAILGRFVVA